jgi:hypothetical protein
MKHTGGCHCKAVRYEVEIDITKAIECNCSRCQMVGLLLAFTPADKFTLLSGKENMATYHFNKNVIDHMFCTTCGVQPFGRGISPDGADTVALNLRTIDDIDLATVTRTPYNGKDI